LETSITPLLDRQQRVVSISKGDYNAYNNKNMKRLLFKLLFAKQADKYISTLLRREKNYKQAKDGIYGYIATSNCRMDFIYYFLNK